MTVWLYTNIALSVLALVFAHFNSNAPHRLRFHACFLALFAWFVPWDLVSRIVPESPAMPSILPSTITLRVHSNVLAGAGESIAGGVGAAVLENVELIMLVATTIGALLFVYSTLQYRQLVRQLADGSRSGSHLWACIPSDPCRLGAFRKKPQLRIQKQLPGAITTGLLAPTIWVNEDLEGRRDFRSVLAHEYQHVKNHDNGYLWFITLIERLLWWNPLVRYLASKTRELLELSCDEACVNSLPGYRETLNRLVLATAGRSYQPMPQTAYIHHSKSFNVRRLRAMERGYAMKTRHYFSAGLLVIGTLVTMSWALAQYRPEEALSIGCPPVRVSAVDEVLEQLRECQWEDITIFQTQDLSADYRIDRNDRLFVLVREEPELLVTVVVAADGTISMPLAANIVASGKTTQELARDVEEVLSRYIRTPDVRVVVAKGLAWIPTARDFANNSA